ncbi:MAG: sugar-binding domain-containing protein, partial [Verrucomicrobiota bacterium]
MLGFWVAVQLNARAEVPGEFRPLPVQNPLENVGATGDKTQPPDTLPKSRAPLLAEPRPDSCPARRPELRGNDLLFNAGWKMIEAPKLAGAEGAQLSGPGWDVGAWHDATVPGTVLTTLVNDGVYPDPCFGLNNLLIPESLNRQDYWYRLEFTAPGKFARRRLWLDFNGINYYAEVWLNGRYLGHITGAFTRGQFDVTPWIKVESTNVLAVMVAPPPDPGIPSEQSAAFGPGDNGGKLSLDGPTFVCTEGWDWIPAIRDRDTGLWQDVILRAAGPVTIVDPQVITSLPLPDVSRAGITVSAEVKNASEVGQAGVLKGSFEGVAFDQPVTVSPGEIKKVVFAPADFPQLEVRHPRLWWPNGYGKPELYHLNLKFVTADQDVSDKASARFGIRELSYEMTVKMPGGRTRRVDFTPTLARGNSQAVIDNRRESMGWRDLWPDKLKLVSVWPGAENSPALKPVAEDGMGSYLVLKVNGQKIFCNGGNWGMDDALKRISRERLEPYIRLHRDAHLTMIRNWAGQSTSETFYDLCDEYGILVWNDFWMNTEGWNYSPSDHDLFLGNVADTIKRFRNHPSIAIWCARNEGVPPEDINQGNDRLIRELDGTRWYQPNSRLVGLRDSGPWDRQPLEKYFSDLNHGFSTEMGAPSIPSAEVLRTMMAKEDLWPPADVWAYHDFHSQGALRQEAVVREIHRRYGETKDLDEFCAKAQMLNYETYRAIYEGFDSRLWNDCSGVLLWMSHPSWPSVVWQLYSSDYEPNASYFGAKKAGEPVHIQMNLPDCGIAVVNH